MTVTALDRALVAGDAGRVTGERQERPDAEAAAVDANDCRVRTGAVWPCQVEQQVLSLVRRDQAKSSVSA